MTEKQAISDLIKDCEKAATKKLTNFQGVQIVVEGDLEEANELVGNPEAEEKIKEPLERLRKVIRQLPSSFHRNRLRESIQKVLDVEYEVRKVLKEIRKSIRELSSDTDS